MVQRGGAHNNAHALANLVSPAQATQISPIVSPQAEADYQLALQQRDRRKAWSLASASPSLLNLPDASGFTFLMVVAYMGDIACVKALMRLSDGEFGGCSRVVFHQTDVSLLSTLMFAARHGHAKVIDVLLVAVPEPEDLLQMTTLQGRNALMLGAIGGQPQVLTALLEAVEDKDEFAQQTAHGISALRLAVLNHRVEAAVALLEAVDNPFPLLAQEGPDGLTALQLAGNMSVSYLSSLRQAAGLESVDRR